MSMFNDLFTRLFGKKDEYVIPVISSVGNGLKGDQGDPFDYDQLTEHQLNRFTSEVASKSTLHTGVANIVMNDETFETAIKNDVKSDLADDSSFISDIASQNNLQNSVATQVASDSTFRGLVENVVESDLSSDSSFITGVAAQQNLQNSVSNQILADSEFVENTTQLLLDDSNFSTNISNSILRIASNINVGIVNVSGTSESIVRQITIPTSCNYVAGDNILVFINGLLETEYTLNTTNKTITLTTGLSHSATVQILVFKLTVSNV